MAYRDQPLGELALSIPRASALFRKYDMDYCCWRARRHVKNWMLRSLKLN